MKRRIHSLAALVICFMLAANLAACGQKTEPAGTQGAGAETKGAEKAPAAGASGDAKPEYLAGLTAPASKKALSVGTGSSSGVWYIIGGGIANAVNLNSQWFTLTSEAASGGGENLRNLQEGNIEIAMLNCDMGYYFYSSTDSYEGAGDDSLRSLIALPSSAMHLVAKAGSGISGLDDLKGKRVAVGTAGSGYESFASKVVACAGLSYDDMKIQMINPSQFADAMKNGQIDAFFYPVQSPGSAITELSISTDVEILSLPDEFLKKFLGEYVGYVQYTIPAGTYKGQDQDVNTLATGQFVSTLRDSMTEDEVYVLMHDIFDNRDSWANVHVSCAEVTDTNIGSLIVPLHAGAIRFYRERGVEIPEELIPEEAK